MSIGKAKTGVNDRNRPSLKEMKWESWQFYIDDLASGDAV
jgi:hypothetical protein